jgi:hypothetical protein
MIVGHEGVQPGFPLNAGRDPLYGLAFNPCPSSAAFGSPTAGRLRALRTSRSSGVACSHIPQIGVPPSKNLSSFPQIKQCATGGYRRAVFLQRFPGRLFI